MSFLQAPIIILISILKRWQPVSTSHQLINPFSNQITHSDG